ncbi:hypothetical protein [Lachnospira eligens]|uniref:Conjugal transfer protein TrbL n=1 Tax=Lachnospira eligens TaxID=39485 RepID=A0A174Z8T4_9FIRM|nr:hypothetical protein [Lachnospira eligens]CUQ82362.1 Uncharacterised protein [Lachnospira eligens]
MNILINPVALAAAPQWVIDLLSGGSVYTIAQELWNFVMGIAYTLMGKNVTSFTTPAINAIAQALGLGGNIGAWDYIKNTAFPLFMSMGAVFLNMFTLIGFCRQASNLKEGITMEAWIELFIKLVIANILMTNCLDIMQEFTGFAITTTKVLLPKGVPTVIGGDYDAGFRLAMLMLAPIYLIISGVCSITVLIEILGRFLNLFMLMAVAPLALSTLAGGRGLENSAIAWFKSFLTNALQIIIIALVMQLCAGLNASLTGMCNTGLLASWFDGAVAVILSLIFMPFMATAVKSSDNFLKRAFDLR